MTGEPRRIRIVRRACHANRVRHALKKRTGAFSILLIENQKSALWIRRERHNLYDTSAKQRFNHGRRTITDSNPNHFWRMTIEKAPLMEVGILRHNGKAMLSSIQPDDSVTGIL